MQVLSVKDHGLRQEGRGEGERRVHLAKYAVKFFNDAVNESCAQSTLHCTLSAIRRVAITDRTNDAVVPFELVPPERRGVPQCTAAGNI